jgi:short-subunit dehydrogenase
MTPRVIVITGASGGIGAALAKQLAARGHNLVISARQEPELNRVAQACGSSTLPIRSDMTKRKDVELLRDEALRAHGHVDVWVNNVGRGIGRAVLDLTDDDFDEMIAVNTKSAWYGMQAIVPHFMDRGEGHLINISSTLSRIPFASYRSIYSAAKAALNSLTANVRMDLRSKYPDIHISLVMPPVVSSDFHANALYGTPGGMPSRGVVQTPEQVAVAITELIDNPKAEIYTDAGQLETVVRYYSDVAAFEANLGR